MLQTPLCQLLGIQVPVIQGPLGGPWEQSMELAAAVCEAGGLGSVPTSLRGAERVPARHGAPARADRPAVRGQPHQAPAGRGGVRRHAGAAAGGGVAGPRRARRPGQARARRGGAVHASGHHRRAGAPRRRRRGRRDQRPGHGVRRLQRRCQRPRAGAAGGRRGGPIPVVASGGIADGRGLAAALALGAQGVNIGTRFLASVECAIPEEWKRSIVEARSEDAVKVEFADLVLPSPTAGGYATVPRSLRTPFVDRWNGRRAEAEREAGRLRDDLGAAMREGRAHELVPLTGQTAGMIDEVLPAAEIVRRLVAEAEAALRGVQPLLG